LIVATVIVVLLVTSVIYLQVFVLSVVVTTICIIAMFMVIYINTSTTALVLTTSKGEAVSSLFCAHLLNEIVNMS
jgi:hypothetical protein